MWDWVGCATFLCQVACFTAALAGNGLGCAALLCPMASLSAALADDALLHLFQFRCVCGFFLFAIAFRFRNICLSFPFAELCDGHGGPGCLFEFIKGREVTVLVDHARGDCAEVGDGPCKPFAGLVAIEIPLSVARHLLENADVLLDVRVEPFRTHDFVDEGPPLVGLLGFFGDSIKYELAISLKLDEPLPLLVSNKGDL